jgi:hypothetical protein
MYTWKSGEKFNGIWEGDRMNGKGLFTYADGTAEEREFRDDRIVQ